MFKALRKGKKEDKGKQKKRGKRGVGRVIHCFLIAKLGLGCQGDWRMVHVHGDEPNPRYGHSLLRHPSGKEDPPLSNI